MRIRTQRSLLERTCDGLDCIDLTYYISADKSLDDVMREIQMDYEYDHLPSDAMAVFRNASFHHDVFRAMDEADFEKYLRSRFEDEDIDLVFEEFWFDEGDCYEDEDDFYYAT